MRRRYEAGRSTIALGIGLAVVIPIVGFIYGIILIVKRGQAGGTSDISSDSRHLRDRRVAVKIATAIGIAAVLIVLLVGGWIGGEMHYRNCLMSAELRYPSAYQPGQAKQFADPQAHFAFYEHAKREDAISSCSRWP